MVPLPRSRVGAGVRSAFTLIELLVVVAILALLIAILLPSLARAREVARRTAGGANMRGIGSGWAMYQSEWDGVTPLSVLGWDRVCSVDMPCKNMDRPLANDFVHQFGYWSYPTIRAGWNSYNGLNAHWMLGFPNALRRYTGGSPESKSWVSPGTGAANPFSVTMDVMPGWPSSPLSWWQYFDTQFTNGTSGTALTQTNGYFKACALMAYQVYSGDAGNTAVHYQTGPMTRYYQVGTGTPWNGFDNNKQRYQEMAPGQIIMQDLAVRDPMSQTYWCNYANGGGLSRDTMYLVGTAAVGVYMQGTNGGLVCYIQGFKIVEKPESMAGVNVLYADQSVEWMPISRTTQVDYASSTGNTWRHYIGVR